MKDHIQLVFSQSGNDRVDRTVSRLRAPADRDCHVLLIEDNEDNRQTLTAILEIYGYRVSGAANGTEGLQLASASSPDIAVIDIGLPGMDGYEVARRLRASADTRSIGLVAVTGFGQEEDRQRALDAGFDRHLVKPVEPAQLLDALARFC